MEQQLRRVPSGDGTRIGVWRSGVGPPLLLVHGAMADHTRWDEVRPPLEQRFTVHAVDRRGRGASDDGVGTYSMQLEVNDIIAVLDDIGGDVTVLGHSYGADIALEAALVSARIGRLILYEPGILEGVRHFYEREPLASTLRSVDEFIAAGDMEAAMLTVMREVIEYPEPDIEAMRASPIWPSRVAAAHTMPREIRAEGAWMFDPGRFRDLTTPTLLLAGSESTPLTREGTAALDEALPNSRVVVMAGQGHGAISTAPGLFTREVLRFP